MEIKVEFEGYVSLNQIYSTPHWSVRSKMKRVWRDKWLQALMDHFDTDKKGLIERFKEIDVKSVELELYVNNRLDIDNNVMAAKFLMDLLQEPTKKTKPTETKLCLIKNDGPTHYTRLEINSDPSLGRGTGIAVLKIVEEDAKLF